MSIECLEPRIAPAAIALTLSGTALKATIAGSSDTIAFATQSTAGGDPAVYVGAGDTVTLNGSPLSPTSSGGNIFALTGHHVGSISVVDANPDDHGNQFFFASPVHGSISVSLAGVSNTINVATPLITGGITVKTPAGGTTVNFQNLSSNTQEIVGPVKLNLGAAGGLVTVGTPQFQADGAFTVTGGPAKAPASPASTAFIVNQTSGSSPYFKVGGPLSFLSPYGAGHFSISSTAVNIGGNLTVTEAGSTISGQAEGITSPITDIGGNLSVHTTGGQSINFSGNLLLIGGKTTVSQPGGGSLTIQAQSGFTSGAMALVGSPTGALIFTALAPTAGSIAPTSGAMISGGVKISGYNQASFGLIGEVGGNFSLSGVPNVNLNTGGSSSSGHLGIGGAFSITASAKSSNNFTVAGLFVGGSFTVTGSSMGVGMNLSNSTIGGNAVFNLGPKVNSPGQSVTITETSGDTQMLIAGSLTANLGPSGTFAIVNQNSVPVPIVYGAATITEPTGATDALTLPTSAFAVPVKVQMLSPHTISLLAASRFR